MKNPARTTPVLCAVIVGFALAVVGTSLACCAGRGAMRSESAEAFVDRYGTVTYLISTGQLKQASALLKKLKRAAKTDEEKGMVEEAFASYYLADGKLAKAERHATLAVAKHPTFAAAFRTRALVKKERGNLVEAEEDLLLALSHDESDTKSLRCLADIYAADNRRFEALSVLERYLEVDPLDARAQDAWAAQMASMLGNQSFPLEYLSCLRSDAVTRGELAAVLVVEKEKLERRAEPSRLLSDTTAAGIDSVAVTGAGIDSGGAVTGLVVDSAHVASGIKRPSAGGALAWDCVGRWFMPFVEKALEARILGLYPDGTFRPDDLVRKGVLTVELYEYLLRTRRDKVEVLLGDNPEGASWPSAETGQGLPHFGYGDASNLSYLWRPMNVLVKLGIVGAESDSLFGVEDVMSGQEARRIAQDLARVVHSP